IPIDEVAVGQVDRGEHHHREYRKSQIGNGKPATKVVVHNDDQHAREQNGALKPSDGCEYELQPKQHDKENAPAERLRMPIEINGSKDEPPLAQDAQLAHRLRLREVAEIGVA